MRRIKRLEVEILRLYEIIAKNNKNIIDSVIENINQSNDMLDKMLDSKDNYYKAEIKGIKDNIEADRNTRVQQVNFWESNFNEATKMMNKIPYNIKKQLRKREYLIRTDFKGTLKNKKLLDEFKNIANKKAPFQENTVKQAIINFEFMMLDIIFTTLKELEAKQAIIDECVTAKPIKKENINYGTNKG